MLKGQNNQAKVLEDASEKVVKLLSIFYRIAKSIQPLLNSLENKVTQDSINCLRSSYKLPICPEIDYDYLAIPFAYLYFLENFWKSAITFQCETSVLDRCVVDAGCGPCTTALAYLASLEAHLSGTKWKIDVLLLDRSKKQLDLAKRVLKCAIREFHHLEIVPHFRCIDLKQWKPKKQSIDVVLFGHVLNENRSQVKLLLDKASSAARDSGRIYIIERKDDSIWQVIDDYVNESALPAKYGTISLDASRSNLHSQISSKDRIVTSYLVLHFPERKYFAQLLSQYFLA